RRATCQRSPPRASFASTGPSGCQRPCDVTSATSAATATANGTANQNCCAPALRNSRGTSVTPSSAPGPPLVRRAGHSLWRSGSWAGRLRAVRLLSSVEVRTDHAVCECEHHELGPRFELQLSHDVRAVRVDRAHGDEELLADLLVRVAQCE